uniref:Tetraspanin n=1 Tax=Poecilia latipinna TaxID=48699 RepID=A0A3B3UNR9_9TELE
MCCTGFLKVMMFIFNGGIFLAGLVILGVGIWVTVDSDSLLNLVEKVVDLPDEVFKLNYVGYMLIGVGAVLLIIGFLGCCGAINENRCMLLTFFSLVLIIFIVEVAGGIVLSDLFVLKQITTMSNYGKDPGMTELWNITMEQSRCCGYKNYTDFYGSPFNIGGEYPPPCCHSSTGPCTSDLARISNVKGCFVKLVELLEENSIIIAGVAIGIASLEVNQYLIRFSIFLILNVPSRDS